MASSKVAVLLLVCIVLGAAMSGEAAITCGQVGSSLAPCITWLKSGVGAPPPTCCNGVRSLAAAAKTTPDRQAACRCLKTAAGAVPAIKESAAAVLPSSCHVSIPYKISRSTNCNTVK